jgi:hypothetical protein
MPWRNYAGNLQEAVKVLQKPLQQKPDYLMPWPCLPYASTPTKGLKLFKLSDSGVVFVEFINEAVKAGRRRKSMKPELFSTQYWR